jgi:hypothetical protein
MVDKQFKGKKMKKNVYFGCVTVLMIFVFFNCVSSPTTSSLILNHGDSINYSLFTHEKREGRDLYLLKKPEKLFVFGAQPSEVVVFLDENEKISLINFMYIYGPWRGSIPSAAEWKSAKDSMKEILVFFDEKANEQNLNLVVDTGVSDIINSDYPVVFTRTGGKVYSNEDGSYGMMFYLKDRIINGEIGCMVSIGEVLSENTSTK